MLIVEYLLVSLVIVLCTISFIMILAFSICQALLAFQYAKAKATLGKLPKPKRPEWQGKLPTMLVQLPLFNELYVVERLLDAVALFDYPKSLLTIQVLDDSTDATTEVVAKKVAELKALGFNAHHIHRIDRTGFKAGALQAGLAVDKSEFVTIFDADFVPQPNYLKQVLGYFTSDNIGLVQTRWAHINRDESILTKLLSFGIDAHFSVEQGGRQASGAFINFNGTAGVWRRKTIDDANGWSSDCLTEDLDLSFRAQLKGWRFLFVEDITTPSELPATMSAVRTQQFRWTKGAAETGRKNLVMLWKSKQSLSTKFIGSFHMLNSLVFLAVLALSLLLIGLTLTESAWAILLAKLTVFIFATSFVFALVTYATADVAGRMEGRTLNVWRSIFTSALFIVISTGLILHNGFAVVQGLLGRITPFVRTPKTKSQGARISGQGLYLVPTSLRPIFLEFILAAMFGWAAYNASAGSHNFATITLAFFAFSFLLVIYFSIREFIAKRVVDAETESLA